MKPMSVTFNIVLRLIFLIIISVASHSLFSQGLGINAATPATKLDVNGDVAMRISSFTAINGDNNNINIGSSSFVRITGPTSGFSITGIAGGVNGKIVVLFNRTNSNMTIEDQTTSTAANQIICSNNSNASIQKNGCATLMYSSLDSRWVLVSQYK
ncbi:MAG: hypothetical protein ACSLE0_00485 [Chitinophagaceae bacterium]